MVGGRQRTILEALSLPRPVDGPCCGPLRLPPGLHTAGLRGWQSNGGAARGHPAKALPFSLDVPLPQGAGVLGRLHLVGVFALFCGTEHEAAGTLGATLQFTDGKETLGRVELINGVHYADARLPEAPARRGGDGTTLQTVGFCDIGGQRCRVDLLSVDAPSEGDVRLVMFRDLGSPASFVLFDAFAEFTPAEGCPFRSHSGGVSLAELGAVLRVGDRARFAKALEQLKVSLAVAEDLDEARGQALTFLAVVTAAVLETGGGREMHRVQLEAARSVEQVRSAEAIAQEVRTWVGRVAPGMLEAPVNPSVVMMNRAMAYVDRNYARALTDSAVARQLGLSTSHFRYLFRQATGQPFHRYLVAVRLEKARQLLLEGQMPVSQVASAVGFTGLSHFSRAFSQRFSVSPAAVRRASA